MNIKEIIFYFLTWRVLLFSTLFLAISRLTLQVNFLGGGLSKYLQTPFWWSWANFDGEHYLLIARSGYQSLTYFYFPLYPVLIRELSRFLSGSLESYLFSALFISHTSFLLGIIGLIKLIRMDYSERIGKTALILLLLFPTSFYFGSVYTESLFFSLVVWSFYFARKRNYLLSGILGGLSTATRITGVALIPALLIEYISSNKIKSFKDIKQIGVFKVVREVLSIMFVSLGILWYMFFLNQKTGDPIAFFTNLNKVYGEQRGESLVLLPQVFYRYFFKILPNLNPEYFPIVFTSILELLCAIIFLIFVVVLFLRFRLSYAVFSMFAYLIPTLSGSFSSLPRYVLVIFPVFLAASVLISSLPTVVRLIIFSTLFAGLIISISFFTRGYWLA